MKNLLQETLDILKENNKTKKDIEWVGGDDFYITWENFEELANVEYDSGFGASKVAIDLIVAGKDFWLERETCDSGSEWWDFKALPIQPKVSTKLKSLTVDQTNELRDSYLSGWQTLNELNDIIK